jgi:hypothetical protein
MSHTEGKHRLKVLDNGMLRKIFGVKREEVTGDWRRLHNEELHDFHSTLHIYSNH